MPVAGKSSQEDKEPPCGQNLGCGSLLVIFLVVALVGKFMPHNSRDSKSTDKKVSAASRTSDTGAANALLGHTGKGTSSGKPVPQTSHSSSLPSGVEASVRRLQSGVQVAIDEVMSHPVNGKVRAILAEPERLDTQPAGTVSRKPMNATFAPASESSNETDWLKSAIGVVAPLLSRIGSDETGVSSVPEHMQAAEKPEKPPLAGAKTAPVEEKPGPPEPVKGSVPDAVSGAVFNSPWNGSVEQVERYLRRHTHDADSVEIVEWGKVKHTPKGFEVRCTFRSRNVLGKVATQSRNFVMTPEGEVSDIRD